MDTNDQFTRRDAKADTSDIPVVTGAARKARDGQRKRLPAGKLTQKILISTAVVKQAA